MGALRSSLLGVVAISFLISADSLPVEPDLAETTASLDVHHVLEQVAEEDREEFLKYHLNHGFELKKKKEGVDYPSPHKLSNTESIQLYEYFMNNYRITDAQKVDEYSKYVCFPGFGCIDLDDPGIYPS